jgi:hypothetical protein
VKKCGVIGAEPEKSTTSTLFTPFCLPLAIWVSNSRTAEHWGVRRGVRAPGRRATVGPLVRNSCRALGWAACLAYRAPQGPILQHPPAFFPRPKGPGEPLDIWLSGDRIPLSQGRQTPRLGA